MKLSARPPSSPKHILVFGPPKSGKSVLAGSVALKYNVIYFDLENGVDSLYRLPPEAQDRIEVIQIPDTRGFPIAISTMLKVIRGDKVRICEEHGAVGCAICAKKPDAVWNEVHLNTLGPDTVVIVDSLTQLTNSAIAHITRNQPEDYKLQQDDWGNLGKLLDTFLSYVQNAPYHIICISHETEVEMPDGKNKLVATAGTRNFSRNTAKYFGEVAYCEIKNGKHRVGTSTTYAGNILTGSRMNFALEKTEQPSLIDILDGVTQTAPAPKPVPVPVKNAPSTVAPTPEPVLNATAKPGTSTTQNTNGDLSARLAALSSNLKK